MLSPPFAASAFSRTTEPWVALGGLPRRGCASLTLSPASWRLLTKLGSCAASVPISSTIACTSWRSRRNGQSACALACPTSRDRAFCAASSASLAASTEAEYPRIGGIDCILSLDEPGRLPFHKCLSHGTPFQEMCMRERVWLLLRQALGIVSTNGRTSRCFQPSSAA